MAVQQRSIIFVGCIVWFGAFCLLLSLFFKSPDNTPLLKIDPKHAFTAPKQNAWAELDETETAQVYHFLHKEARNLNLTRNPRNGYDNYIMYAEVLRPNKTDVLPYLANKAAAPQRWARVALSRNVDNEAYIEYYAVGPLPITAESTMTPLEYCYNAGRNWVKNPIPSFLEYQSWGIKLAANISDITWQLLGAAANPDDQDDPDGLVIGGRAVRIEDGSIVNWMEFYRPGIPSNARSILPQGFYIKLNTSNVNSGEWEILQWYYNDIYYDTVEEFRAAIARPDFELLPINEDGPWTDVEDFDATPSGRELPPPVMVQPNGVRYQLDKKEQYVSWMGFEFFIATSQATGLSLFDIRFKGESVIYELGLQEAMAHYAGSDPVQGGQEFLDTFFGMGKFQFELVRGYDCPGYADYLDNTYHQAEKKKVNPNAICVFEYTADHLLQRHTSRFHVSVSRSTYLVVRAVSTVGNYDYTIDYLFYLDGTIEVKVRASGFIFAAFYPPPGPSSSHYGYRLHDAASSSMHDHVINFKADMDVAGSSNTFTRLGIEPLTTSYAWDKPEAPQRNTMHLVEYPMTEETGLNWPKNSGEMYIVYHSSKTNKWGERRGYRITPGTGMGSPPHLTIQNSTTLGRSALWSERDVWVLKHHDTEPRAADPLNYISPHDPLVDFSLIANGEALSNPGPEEEEEEAGDDLVLYFNIGAHHVPHSGDIPNTLMHTSASSVMFVPHNFHDRDPSRAVSQGVRLDLSGKNDHGWSMPSSPDKDNNVGDLRAAKRGEDEDVRPRRATANYFGTPYTAGVRLQKEDLEPDVERYDPGAGGNGITDLDWSKSMLGVE